MLSLFDDKWLWNLPSASSIEETIKAIIENDFVNNPNDAYMRETFDFSISCTTSTSGAIEEKDVGSVVNFQDFLISIYNLYDIISILGNVY